jgi:hypothetical protein
MKETYIELCNGGLASKHLHDDVRNKVHEVTSRLDPHKIYKLKDLYGKKSWGKLSVAERCVAENCMVDFALNQEVSLNYIGTSHNNFALYQLA